MKNKLWIFVVVGAIIILSGFLIYQKQNKNISIKTTTITTSNIQINTGKDLFVNNLEKNKELKILLDSTWKKYKNEELGIVFEYPVVWGNPIVENGSISFEGEYEGYLDIDIKNIDSFLCLDKDFKKINSNIIEDQFYLLEKISKATKLNDDLRKKILLNFNLFSLCIWGSDERMHVDLIHNTLGNMQGARIIGYKGSDISALNYYYLIVFLKDNKIISGKFPLFFGESVDWADSEMIKPGTNPNENRGLLYENIMKAINNQDKNSGIYRVVEEYDKFARSLYLLP